jgi:hypothetical protein
VRRLSVGAVALVGCLAIPAANGAAPLRLPPLAQHFFSRPDLKPQGIHLETQAAGVSRWRLLAGLSPDQLTAVASALKPAFETGMPLPADAASVAVEAVGADGTVLARSKTLPRR